MTLFIQVIFICIYNINICWLNYYNFNCIYSICVTGGRLASNNMSSHYVPNLGQSVFDYIEKYNARTSIFYNFMYMPNSEQPVNIYLWHF